MSKQAKPAPQGAQSVQSTLKIMGGPVAPPAKQVPVKIQFRAQVAAFDAWWALTANRRKLNPALKLAVRRHFEAAGFMKSGQFDAGLKHFGL